VWQQENSPQTGTCIEKSALFMSKRLKTTQQFANETEERAFDSTDYLDWSNAQSVVLPNLKPATKTIALRLPQH